MIDQALTFLKDRLETSLKGDDLHDKSALVGYENGSIKFAKEAVNVVFVGIEEEKTLRSADRYQRTSTDGKPQRVQPDIALNLYVLFVSNFKDYEQGLRYLSLIIRHFQQRPVFDHQTAPELDAGIEMLIMELHSMSLPEQHELWQALGKTYHPSILYKVKMIVFRDETPVDLPPVKETGVNVRRLP
jgi:hypothetical protein